MFKNLLTRAALIFFVTTATVCGAENVAKVENVGINVPEFDQSVAFTESGSNYGFFAKSEWLNWTADQTNADYANKLDSLWLTPKSTSSLKSNGNGLRAICGYCFANDWDVSFGYVYYRGKDKGSETSVERGDSVLKSSKSFLDLNMKNVSASTQIRTNFYDVETGRRLQFNSLGLRPFGGFRFLDVAQDFNADGAYDDLSTKVRTNDVFSSSRASGYGFRLGCNGRCDLFGGFSIFGDVAASALTGDIKSVQLEYDKGQGRIVNNVDKSSNGMMGIETKVGAAWSFQNLTIEGGYELNSLTNATRLNGQYSDITLRGFFAGASWNRSF